MRAVSATVPVLSIGILRGRREQVRSGRRWRAAAAALLAGTLLAAGCSFDYTEAGPSPDELLERVPETEFTEVTRTIVRDGRVVAEIQAQRVLNFRRRARTILLDVQYTEYDAAGNAVTTGSAERATYYTERKDAELAGSIRLRSDSQEVRLEADTLRWEDQRRRLVTGPEAVVEILRDDGSQVTGTGLEVDVRRKTIRFTGPVSGALVTQTDGSAPR